MTKEKKENDFPKFNNNDNNNAEQRNGEEKITKKEEEPLLDISFNDTSEISVPPRLIDQVIGQDDAVEIIKKAALQKRHIMLIGDPGTGKSMLGQAMAELLPKEDLVDILCLPNPKYPNQPRIASLPAGHGSRKVQIDTELAKKKGNKRFIISLIILIGIIGYAIIATSSRPDLQPQTLLMAMFVGFFIFFMLNQSRSRPEALVPKLLVDNSNRKRAPFNDATGSHAGALLGDVRHDPFQSFFDTKISLLDSSNNYQSVHMSEIIDKLVVKAETRVETKKENNYEAVLIKEGELKVLADNNGKASFVDILSVNRYDYDGELIKIKLDNGKEIITTPEHKIAVKRNGEIKYISAIEVDMNTDEFVVVDKVIIDDEDILKTYSSNQQKQAQLYFNYLQFKESHPNWRNKKQSKFSSNINHKYKWDTKKNHKPIAVQTIEKLHDLNLLPLTLDNPKLPVISRIIGRLFGDGELSSNLNGISLSSRELENIKAFEKDLELIFGKDISLNSKIFERREKGHHWCYQNTNGTLISFFTALGVPVGNKTKMNLVIPSWVYFSKQLQEEFFGSFISVKMGLLKGNVSERGLNKLNISITANDKTLTNRIELIKEVKYYLNRKGVETQELTWEKVGKKNQYLIRLLITNYESVLNFVEKVRLNYCNNKTKKIKQMLNEFIHTKYECYNDLISEGLSAEQAMNLLNLSPRDLYHIISQTEEENA